MDMLLPLLLKIKIIMQTKTNNIDEYINNFPENVQNILTEIRTIIQKIVP